ncbi:MAG: UrcA family protein [Oceanicaulis sp.]
MFTALLASALFSADVQTVEIRFTERDLVEPARVEALREDIRRAARDVCGVNDTRPLAQRRVALRCAAEAEADADAQLSRAVARAGVIEVAAAQ